MPLSHITGRRLLVAAALLHVAAAAAVQWAGRAGWYPDHIDSDGFMQGSDSQGHRALAAALAGRLADGDWTGWWATPAQAYVRLYSLAFAAAAGWSSPGPLAAEAVNLPCYLLTLVLVARLGREACGAGVGRSAAAVVAVWPSLLLHGTQMLRDPLYVVLLLSLVLLVVTWLTRRYTWRAGLAGGLRGAGLALGLWVLRGQMWEVAAGVALAGTGLLLLRQVRERRILGGNLVAAALLLVALAVIPSRVPTIRHSDWDLRGFAAPTLTPAEREVAAGDAGTGRSRLSLGPARRVMALRGNFLANSDGVGSNLDMDVEFRDTADVVRYLPRALLIGWGAPFPDMWVSAGSSQGRAGRVVAGLETSVIYLLTPWALVGVGRRRTAAAVFLLLVAVGGMTALGLVVTNAGSLFRARYAFWILVVLLGVAGGRDGLRRRVGPAGRAAPESLPGT